MPQVKNKPSKKAGGKKVPVKKKTSVSPKVTKVQAKIPESCINIMNQTVRWDVVKRAHRFKNDVDVAKLLLDCYDIIITGCLKWSIDIEKTRIPSMASDDGWRLLDDVISVMKWKARQPVKKRMLKEWSEDDDDDDVDLVDISIKQEAADNDDSEDYVPDGLEDVGEDSEDNQGEPQPDQESASGTGANRLKINLKTKKVRRIGEESKVKNKKKKYPNYPKKGYRKSGRPRKVLEFLNTSDLPKMFECKRCKERFSELEAFKEHFKIHSDSVVIGNTIQQLAFISIEAIPEIATVFVSCPTCRELTSNYGVHQQKHFNQICDQCGKLFQSFSGWRRHLKYHKALESGEKAHVCDKCGKGFILISALTEHRRLHSKERPHTCDVCGKGFKQKAHLRRHLYIHSEVKPISCKFCGKGFTNNFNMKSHLRSHTGERPFICNKCGKSFAHNGSLKTHMKSEHHIDVEYVCQSVQEFDDFPIPKKTFGRAPGSSRNGQVLAKTSVVTEQPKSGAEKEIHEALKSIAAGMQNQEDENNVEPVASHSQMGNTEVQSHPIMKALENVNYSKEVREALLSIAAVSSAVDLRMMQGEDGHATVTSEEIKSLPSAAAATRVTSEISSSYPASIRIEENDSGSRVSRPLPETTAWQTTHSTNTSMHPQTMTETSQSSTPLSIAGSISGIRPFTHTVMEPDLRESRSMSHMSESSMRYHSASTALHLSAQPSHRVTNEVVDRGSPSPHATAGSMSPTSSQARVLAINESDMRPPIRDLSRLTAAETRVHMQGSGHEEARLTTQHSQRVMHHMPIVSEALESNRDVDRENTAYDTVEVSIPHMTQQQGQGNRQLTLL